ncbi:MAG: hypothetical protein V7682_02315 [Cycloclasticus sp.]
MSRSEEPNKQDKKPISREALYELAWAEPMTSIGKKLGVSSSYLARIYTRLNVPRPAAGYWAKVAADKPQAKEIILSVVALIQSADTLSLS